LPDDEMRPSFKGRYDGWGLIVFSSRVQCIALGRSGRVW
jgi:hypothetical protein